MTHSLKLLFFASIGKSKIRKGKVKIPIKDLKGALRCFSFDSSVDLIPSKKYGRGTWRRRPKVISRIIKTIRKYIDSNFESIKLTI